MATRQLLDDADRRALASAGAALGWLALVTCSVALVLGIAVRVFMLASGL